MPTRPRVMVNPMDNPNGLCLSGMVTIVYEVLGSS